LEDLTISEKPYTLIGKLKGHKKSVICIDIKETQSLLITGSEDKTARVWDLRTGKSTKCLLGFADSINSVSFSPTKDHIVYAASSNLICSYDLRNPDVLIKSPVAKFDFNTEEVNQISIKDSHLAACDDSGEIKIIDLDKGAVAKTLRRQHTNVRYLIYQINILSYAQQ